MNKPKLVVLSERDLDDIRAEEGALNAPFIHYGKLGVTYADAEELRAWRASQNTSKGDA